MRNSLGTRVVRAMDALFGAGLQDSLDRARARNRQLRRAHSFQAALTNRLFADWPGAILDTDDEMRGSLSRLRGRARELRNNDAYVEQFCTLLKVHVVGPTGMRHQAQVYDPAGRELLEDVNRRIEEAWHEYWTGPVTADGQLTGVELEHLLLENTAIDGEQFVRHGVSPRFRHGLGLYLIDPDLVDELRNRMAGREGPEMRLGIEIDSETGARIAYEVYERIHQTGTIQRDPIRIPAAFMTHIFRPRRANQIRGYTWLAPVMGSIKINGGYFDAELVAARAAAAKMGFIKPGADSIPGEMGDEEAAGANVTDEGVAGADGIPPSMRRPIEAAPGTIEELPPGWTFESWDPSHPNTAFSDFTKAILRKIAGGLGVTYHSLTNDLADVNFSSIRAGTLLERDVFRMLQHWWIARFRQPIYEAWLQAAILSGRLDLRGDWRQYRAARWRPRGWQWVDPRNDMQAAVMGLDNLLTSHAELAAERGMDIEDLIEEIQNTRKLFREAGIELPKKAPPTPPRRTEPPDDDEDDDA